MRVVRRFSLRALTAVAAATVLALPSAAAATGIGVRVAPVHGRSVAFRFSGLEACETVIANAHILALLGPTVEVVVRRGGTLVARDGWLACTQAGHYQPWDRPTTRGGDWTAVGKKNVFTLTSRLTRPGRYRYAYSVTVDGARVKRGQIRVSVTSADAVRVALG
jgi:hypothetical protein